MYWNAKIIDKIYPTETLNDKKWLEMEKVFN